MKTALQKWIGRTILGVAGLGGLGASSAEAQFFNFSYNSPGLAVGVGQPGFYGGYYPVAPVVVPRPVVVAPPVVYGPRPFYPGVYGYRGGYYGGHHGGYYGGGYGPRRPYY